MYKIFIIRALFLPPWWFHDFWLAPPEQRYWQNRQTANVGLDSSVGNANGRAPARQCGGRRFKFRSSQFFFVHLTLYKLEMTSLLLSSQCRARARARAGQGIIILCNIIMQHYYAIFMHSAYVHVHMHTYALCGHTRHLRTCRYAAIRLVFESSNLDSECESESEFPVSSPSSQCRVRVLSHVGRVRFQVMSHEGRVRVWIRVTSHFKKSKKKKKTLTLTPFCWIFIVQ